MKKTITGFTVVELIVTITVLAILAGIIYVGYNGTQERSRDVKRMNDLAMIAEAIQLYREKEGHDVQTVGTTKADCGRYDIDGVTPLGGGSSNGGSGWFNHATTSTTSYSVSVLKCLTYKGYLNDSFIDPSGCTTTNSSAGSSLPNPSCDSSVGVGYMKYSCVQGGQTVTYIYARLETSGSTTDVLNGGGCSASFVTTSPYLMNYFVKAG